MTDEGTPSTLIVVAIVVQFITMILFAGVAGFFYSLLPLLASIPPSALPPGLTLADLTRIMQFATFGLAGLAVLSLILAIIWMFWRKEPSKYRAPLVITGVIALILTGFLGGLLAIIAGAIAEKKPKPGTFPQKEPAPVAPAKGVAFCSACGAALAEPNATYCGACGAKTT